MRAFTFLCSFWSLLQTLVWCNTSDVAYAWSAKRNFEIFEWDGTFHIFSDILCFIRDFHFCALACKYFGNYRKTLGTAFFSNLRPCFPGLCRKSDSMKCSLHMKLFWFGSHFCLLTAQTHLCKRSGFLWGKRWNDIPDPFFILFVQPKATQLVTILPSKINTIKNNTLINIIIPFHLPCWYPLCVI